MSDMSESGTAARIACMVKETLKFVSEQQASTRGDQIQCGDGEARCGTAKLNRDRLFAPVVAAAAIAAVIARLARFI